MAEEMRSLQKNNAYASATNATTNKATTTGFEENQAHGQVLMGEEVYATWIATSLVLAVMGTQFTSRPAVNQTVRISLDIATMTISLLVMLWATFSHFNLIKHRTRIIILIILITFLVVLILSVIICVAQVKV